MKKLLLIFFLFFPILLQADSGITIFIRDDEVYTEKPIIYQGWDLQSFGVSFNLFKNFYYKIYGIPGFNGNFNPGKKSSVTASILSFCNEINYKIPLKDSFFLNITPGYTSIWISSINNVENQYNLIDDKTYSDFDFFLYFEKLISPFNLKFGLSFAYYYISRSYQYSDVHNYSSWYYNASLLYLFPYIGVDINITKRFMLISDFRINDFDYRKQNLYSPAGKFTYTKGLNVLFSASIAYRFGGD